MSVLDRIVRQTRIDLESRRHELQTPVASDRDFKAALCAPGLSLIAEIKRRSPSRGDIRPGCEPIEIAKIYDRHASAMSVLTDKPFFGGCLEDLTEARSAARIPVIRKDFIVDPWQIQEARLAGADAVLLMASVLDTETIEQCLSFLRRYEMNALVEVHSQDELDAVLGETSADIVGINSRDLTTLEINDEVIFRLAPIARKAGKTVVAESGVHDRSQVDRLRDIADAVLIGSSLMKAPDIDAKLVELGW